MCEENDKLPAIQIGEIEMPETPCPKCKYPIEVSIQRKGGHLGIDASVMLTCTRSGCETTWFLKLRDDQVIPISGAWSESDFKPDVPVGLIQDVLEADKARLVGAYKGAVVICRRVLQLALEELGAEGRTLGPVRRDAEEKNLIGPRISVLVHGIQDFGDGGAHRREEFEEYQIVFIIAGTINILNEFVWPLATQSEIDSNEA